jgi:yecA family protein
MLTKGLKRRYFAKSAPPLLLPPNLCTLEARPFTPEDSQTLRAWLAEPGWPRGTMDVAMLEGYLVALLVWPIGISSGAWLPPIWNEKSGWRVPAKIATRQPFDKFIELVVGLLRDLDSRLADSPAVFVPTLLPDERGRRWPRKTGVSWAHGFLRALQLSAQGLQGPSDTARSAVTSIARYGSFEVASSGAEFEVVVANLTSAIIALVSERPSRGPLGALKESSDAPNLASLAAARRLLRHRD